MLVDKKIISGKEMAEKIKEEVKRKILKLEKKNQKIPCLAVIMVGENQASDVYVKNKEKACQFCNIELLKFKLKQDTTESELLNLLDKLNIDTGVNGILVQLPLPKHINVNNIMSSISPDKDVDCFSPYNVGKLLIGDYDFNESILPCTPKGCIKLIKSVCHDLSGKKACVIGRSNIAGKPISCMLLRENCTVKITHSKTVDLKKETKTADILVVAVGKPKFIKKDMIKKGAIVIDVGINRLPDGKVCGDVDFDDVIQKVSYVTPVPGGVGCMTIACLMENIFNAFIKQNSDVVK